MLHTSLYTFTLCNLVQSEDEGAVRFLINRCCVWRTCTRPFATSKLFVKYTVRYGTRNLNTVTTNCPHYPQPLKFSLHFKNLFPFPQQPLQCHPTVCQVVHAIFTTYILYKSLFSTIHNIRYTHPSFACRDNFSHNTRPCPRFSPKRQYQVYILKKTLAL